MVKSFSSLIGIFKCDRRLQMGGRSQVAGRIGILTAYYRAKAYYANPVMKGMSVLLKNM